jgi:hypothetical protein
MTQTREKPEITTIAGPTTLTGFLIRRVLFSLLALFASGIIFTVLTLFLNEYISDSLKIITNSATVAVVAIITTSASIAIALIALLYWILHKGGFFKLTYPNSCS